MARRLTSVLSLLFLTAGIVQSVYADIPKIISYQGKVTDAVGTPVSDGAYTMQFRIYNVSAGGNWLWSSGDQSVDVIGGVFSVLLGESPQNSIDLPFDQDYWLLVRFDGVYQTPRQKLVSAGYAYMASGLVAGTEVIGSGSYAAIKGTNTATSSNGVIGVQGTSHSISGLGIYGHAAASTGVTYGVYGMTSSTSGRGVQGYASATTGTTYGVFGEAASSQGYGAYGKHSATTGTEPGMIGVTASTSFYSSGVVGTVESTTPGGYSAGVRGINNSTTGNGIGVYGSQDGSGVGIYGTSSSGTGVYGSATDGSGNSYGVVGESNSNSGVGVYGVAGAGTGGDATGVYGWSSAVIAKGVHGRVSSPNGVGVYYTGGLAGTGSKSCVVRTSQGPTTFYCQESPESWFEDFGGGQLIDGWAHVELDPLFLEAVTVDEIHPLRVFVQLNDETSQRVVVKKGDTGFDVIELENGSSNGTFDYRVVAKRKGFEARRLDVCEAARTDPYLYPEYRGKQRRELEEDRARMDDQAARMQAEPRG